MSMFIKNQMVRLTVNKYIILNVIILAEVYEGFNVSHTLKMDHVLVIIQY